MTHLTERIQDLLAKQSRVIIAIDGSCAAGKTTLAEKLAGQFDCNLFHMDDFFLRPHQRTAERLAQPGGNVDHERFWQEVLLPLQTGAAFSYRPYDCGTGQLADPVHVQPKQLNIVEGSYSHHPAFGSCYDLRIFLEVSPEVRRQRILQRPAFLHRRFFEEWIPMEQQYFASFSVAEHSDLILKTE